MRGHWSFVPFKMHLSKNRPVENPERIFETLYGKGILITLIINWFYAESILILSYFIWLNVSQIHN